MKFTYRSGQRPLDGYTLKRGVGRGGFGEVYFAVSDGGKEVALKLLKGQSDVELRGVANCLNLKHPNLVHIYDLKTDGHGDSWLVMEYVLGESLAQVIDRHPTGLPVHLAAEWFQILARAVNYLHDHGVVHRDLKPANVFVETGNLKVGDYGLCKAMTNSGRQQTQTVGTVHYMAPEISTGNYTRSIDIYACGVMLHEMLTGKLPFDGDSDGEILMKHLTATPSLDGVPAAFRPVLERALDKNPAKRYATVAEMARAVEAAYPTQAGPAAPPLAKPALPVVAPAAAAVKPLVAKPVPVASPVAAKVVPLAPVGYVRHALGDVTGAMLKVPLVAAAGCLAWAVFSQQTDSTHVGKTFLMTTAVAWAVLAATAGAANKASDTWGRRFRQAALGLAVGLFAFWLDGHVGPQVLPDPDQSVASDLFFFDTVKIPETTGPVLLKYLLYFGAVFGACRWWKMAAKDRKDRFSLAGPIAAGFWGAVLIFLWPGADPFDVALVPLAVSGIAVQVVSPWQAPPPPLPKKLKWVPA